MVSTHCVGDGAKFADTLCNIIGNASGARPQKEYCARKPLIVLTTSDSPAKHSQGDNEPALLSVCEELGGLSPSGSFGWFPLPKELTHVYAIADLTFDEA